MGLLQAFRRIGQQLTGLEKSFTDQSYQFIFLRKVYQSNGLVLKMTCSAFPEQYEVFKDGNQVAYMRLRHGEFRVNYKDHFGEEIYCLDTEGDGMFDTSERLVCLFRSMKLIINQHTNENKTI